MTLLAALRTGTREAHARLEDDLDVLQRCRDPRSYADLLGGFRSLYAPLERALDGARATATVVPDFADRRKTGWLDADLAALGAAPPPDRDVPALTGVEEVAGACYVLEGATLGGAVVVRRITDGGTGPLPHRFFSSYGSRRGAMWSGFRASLTALDVRGVDRDRTVEAAQRTFALFAQACR